MGIITTCMNSKEIEENLLKKFSVYNPDFGEGFTESSRKCIDIVIANVHDLDKKQGLALDKIYSQALKRNINRKALKIILEKSDEAMSKIFNGESAIELLENPPNCIAGKRCEIYRELIIENLKYNHNVSRMCLALHSSPCFFEKEDIPFDISFFQNPRIYFPEQKNKGEYKSRYRTLRHVLDVKQTVQRVDLALIVEPEEEIRIKYIVHNKTDKLDSVVTINKNKEVKINHYHVEMKTPRDKTLFPNLVIQLIESSRTGNYLIKGEINGSNFYQHRNEQQMQENYLYTFLSKETSYMFLGGYAYLNILEQIKENFDNIIATVNNAIRLRKPQNLENRVRGLESALIK